MVDGQATAIGRIAILGATGNLTRRSLLPAIARLLDEGLTPASCSVTAVGRRDWSDRGYLDWATASPFATDRDAVGWQELARRLHYRTADVTVPAELRAALAPADGPLVIYLALPPAQSIATVTAIAAAGVPRGSRIVLEKPFGDGLSSARELNALLHEVFPEDAVYRIDHFLHKQTVQNIVGLRFANRIFEPIWSREHIESVDIVWDETLGLDGRAGYYDRAGALVDMVQNHLLQLLCLIAMEPPATVDARDMRDRKAEVLRAVGDLPDGDAAARTVRARYGSGQVAGRPVVGYLDEQGVVPARATETYAEVELLIENWRWSGVPFRLRTGKALAQDRREIAVRFRNVPHVAFPQTDPATNDLRLTLDPDTIRLGLNVNAPRDPFEVERIELQARLATQDIPAYGRLLLGVLAGDPTFSIRDDEAEEAWRIVEPIRRAWASGRVPLVEYPAGSDGPPPIRDRAGRGAPTVAQGAATHG
jgi:glucose-6-phosphate 1-dehydrogenase